MEITRKRRLELLVHHGLFVVLVVAAATLLAYLAREYRYEHDLTRAHRNTLSAATIEVLKQLDGPVTITAYAVARDARGDNVHRRVEELVRPYQREKTDLKLVLVDPREQPQAAEQAGVRGSLELFVEYRKRSERLTEFNEQAFANALMRLARKRSVRAPVRAPGSLRHPASPLLPIQRGGKGPENPFHGLQYAVCSIAFSCRNAC